MSNTETFRQLGNLFGVAKSTAWNIVQRVASFMVILGRDYIKWPTQESITHITEKFEQMKGIPNVVGAIDGTHVKIRAPNEHPQDYFNRKKYYSIVIQVVVDSNKKFIDVCCGEPGSLHDSRILRRSNLYRKCEENFSSHFPPNTFLLGDSAYPVKQWLVTPFKDNGNLSDVHRRFNKVHSGTRVVVENAIGLLKTRFRRILHFTEQMHINLLVNIVYSACVLHNICMEQTDYFVPSDDYEGDNNIPSSLNCNESLNADRQDLLFRELIRKNII